MRRRLRLRLGVCSLLVSAVVPLAAGECRCEAVLRVNAAQSGAPISPLIYGGACLITHLGSLWVTDGGLFWECMQGKKSPTIAEISDKLPNTFITPLKELGIPIIKLCGYNFCSGSWRDWITAIDLGLEFCERIGAEPMFDFDWAPADFAKERPSYPYMSKGDRAALMEYCNSADISKGMGKLRAERGHPEPHNVQYWVLGGECWHYGKHYYPDKDYAAQYGRDLVDWVPAMRAASPIPIRVGVDLCRWQSDWNRTVIETAGNYVDFGGDHPVFPGADASPAGKEPTYRQTPGGTVFREAPPDIQPSLAFTASPLQLARWIDDIHTLVQDAIACGKMRRENYVRWGQTDYLIWRDPHDDGSNPRDCEFQSIMTMAVELQVLMQNNALLACYWETVGARRPWAIVESDGRKLGQYHLLDMLIHNFGERLLDCRIRDVPTYDAPEFGQLMQPAKSVPMLAVCAALATNGDACFYAINRDAQQAIPLRIDIESFPSKPATEGSAWTLTAPSMTSPPEQMSVTKEQVTLQNTTFYDPQRVNVVYSFPARSITVLRLFGARAQ